MQTDRLKRRQKGWVMLDIMAGDGDYIRRCGSDRLRSDFATCRSVYELTAISPSRSDVVFLSEFDCPRSAAEAACSYYGQNRIISVR